MEEVESKNDGETNPEEKKKDVEMENKHEQSILDENEKGGDDNAKSEKGGDDNAKSERVEKTIESEQDAPIDDRTGFDKDVKFNDCDSSLDVICSHEGCLITSLSQGGFQYLLSGIRSNVGAKSGRYLFEVKILEYLRGCQTELRVGVSTSKSTLLLGTEPAESVSFSYDGSFFCPTPEGTRHRIPQALGKKKNFGSSVVAVLLNLDASTPTANTISIFLNGVRSGDPQPIPQSLLGKVLFPTLTFKNVTLQVNLGCKGMQLKALPFKCNMFGNLAAEDAAESQSFTRPSNGRYSVVVPVG